VEAGKASPRDRQFLGQQIGAVDTGNGHIPDCANAKPSFEATYRATTVDPSISAVASAETQWPLRPINSLPFKLYEWLDQNQIAVISPTWRF